MIYIKKPQIELKADSAYLSALVCDEKKGKNYNLWFSVERKYLEFLNDEIADPFLVIVLQIAMLSNQDIVSESPVSERLLFNIVNGVMPILNKLYPDNKQIHITAPTIATTFRGTANGTGCSFGVDSFSAIIDLMSDKLPEQNRLTHLALFNSGQHGDTNLEGAEKQFLIDVEAVREPAKEMGLDVVGINSNINELFKEYKYPLLHRFVITTCAFPLTLQKLFKSYTYASSYPIDNFSMNPEDVSHAEYALVPLFSTESTGLHNSNPTYTRVEKTKILSKSDVAKRHLNVCWSNQLHNMYGTDVYLKGKTKLNCGICDKCIRTLFTLEVIGKIGDFEDIFDIDAYRSYRTKYLVKLLSQKKNDIFLKEIYNEMKEQHFPIPFKVRLMSFGARIGLYKLAQRLFKFTVMAHD